MDRGALQVEHNRYELIAELRRFHDLEYKLLFTRLLRVMCLGVIAFELSVIMFLFDLVPNDYGALVTIVLWTIPVFVFMAVVASRMHKQTMALRNRISRRFTELGLRVDEAGRLLSKAGQSQVVVSL